MDLGLIFWSYHGKVGKFLAKTQTQAHRLGCIYGALANLGFVIGILIKPDFRPASEHFLICAKEQPTDDRLLPILSIKEYQAAPHNFTLCQAPFDYQADNGYSRIALTQFNQPDEYLLITYNDSMGDPAEYHYRITGDKVEPIAWRYGTTMAKAMGYFWGLVLSMIIYSLGKRFYRKK